MWHTTNVPSWLASHSKEIGMGLGLSAVYFSLNHLIEVVARNAYEPVYRTAVVFDEFWPNQNDDNKDNLHLFNYENDPTCIDPDNTIIYHRSKLSYFLAENLNPANSGGASLSPAASATVSNNVSQQQRDQITQPSSGSSSPLASPGLTNTNFNLASNSYTSCHNYNGSNISATIISNANSNSCSSSCSNATSTFDPNWQASKSSVRERNAAMFNNELISDVRFVVGSQGHTQTIPAHKYVLATGSSVFYAMFYGGLAESNEEILVPDVDPPAFLILLKYLYCDEIQLEADTILGTLYAAKKYIVPHLARACVSYLETSLTAKNACMLLSQSRLFEEPDLMQRCWEVIDAQAEMALKADCFVEIDMHTLEMVLARETLNCKEMHLFEAALRWAAAECARLDLEPSATNKRTALGNALYLLRIPTMTLEEFANGVAQLGILTLQETFDIFLNFTAHNKPKLNYSASPRTGLRPQICHRFQSCAYRSNQWRYRGRCDSIQFSVDKRIFVVGFGLYGSSNGAADYKVKIELKRLGQVLAECRTNFFSDGSSNTFHVYFDHPIQVEPECFYTASAVLDGGELSYFGQEGLSEVVAGCCVTFQFQCSSESTNGTGVQGGQIPELIFYGPAPHPPPSPSSSPSPSPPSPSQTSPSSSPSTQSSSNDNQQQPHHYHHPLAPPHQSNHQQQHLPHSQNHSHHHHQ